MHEIASQNGRVTSSFTDIGIAGAILEVRGRMDVGRAITQLVDFQHESIEGSGIEVGKPSRVSAVCPVVHAEAHKLVDGHHAGFRPNLVKCIKQCWLREHQQKSEIVIALAAELGFKLLVEVPCKRLEYRGHLVGNASSSHDGVKQLLIEGTTMDESQQRRW